MIRVFLVWIGLAAVLCCDSVSAKSYETPLVEPSLAESSSSPEPIVIGLPIRLPVVNEVQDPVFSILIGLIENQIYGTLTQSRLQSEIDRQDRSSKIPYRSIREVIRLPRSEVRSTGEVTIRFDGDIKLPIPYSILGYNPGSLRATSVCVFQEWDLGDLVVAHPVSRDDDHWRYKRVELKNAHLFGIVEGTLLLDIDGWLDKLLGGKLDDTEITALLLCQYEGDWHGFAMGYNANKKGRSGALNFRKDKVVFPSPAEIKTVGRKMRSRAEQMMAGKQSP